MDDESYARSLAGEFEMNPPRNDFFHPPSVIGGGVGNGWNMNANPFIPTLNKKAARFQPYPLSDGCDPTVKKAKTLKTILKKKEEDKKLPQIPEIPPVPAAAVKDDDEEEDEDGSDDDEEEDMDEEMTTTLCLKMSKLSRRYVDIIQSQQRMIQQLTEYVVRLKAEQEEADQV